MTFDQKKYDNGEYGEGSLYHRLGELEKESKRIEPLMLASDDLDIKLMYQSQLDFNNGKITATKEIIAQVEARVGELKKDFDEFTGYVHDRNKHLIRIEELTRWLEGEKARGS